MDLIHTDITVTSLSLSPEGEPPQPMPEQVQGSPLAGRDPFTSSHRRRLSHLNAEARISELENENRRLHRLVAELLIKNQQLRRCP
jgi:hypothetical protein